MLSFLASIMIPLMGLSLVFLVVAIVRDVIKKKFFWTKFALVAVAIALVIIVITISYTYNVTTSIINGR